MCCVITHKTGTPQCEYVVLKDVVIQRHPILLINIALNAVVVINKLI